MQTSKVLVTGGTGVIASWVVREFVERGIEPVIFVRGQTSDAIGKAINGDIAQRITRVQGDVLDPMSLIQAVREHRPDTIVHLASAKPWQMEPPWVAEPKPRVAIDQIVHGTINVLDTARAFGIQRVVYAGSKASYASVAGEYGAPTYKPLNEDYPLIPNTLYGIAKETAEHLGGYYADTFGLEFAALRFATTYGPLKRGSTDSPGGMLMAAAEGKPVRIHASAVRDDYVYNKDAAHGLVLATLVGTLPRRAYNLGSGFAISTTDIAEAIRNVVPGADIAFTDEPVSAASGGHANLCSLFDNGRAEQDLGYHPRFGRLEDAFVDFLAEEERIKRIAQPAAAMR